MLGPHIFAERSRTESAMAMNSREEDMSLRLKGVQHGKAGGACWKGERRSESRLHFNDLGTSGMKMIKLNHNRAATVICTHTIKRLQNAMQS